MRHIISILMSNEAGALVRVAGMFSQRGYNIESLNVAATEQPEISRLTLVTDGSEKTVSQINRQLLKLVDVIQVHDMTSDNHIKRELALFKSRPDSGDTKDAIKLGEQHQAELLAEEDGSCIFQIVGGAPQVDAFAQALNAIGELEEEVRSGSLAITKGPDNLKYAPGDDFNALTF